MGRTKALLGKDAKKLVKLLKSAKTVEEAKKIIAEFTYDNKVEKSLNKWVERTFKLGHESTGFHFDIEFGKLDEEVKKWVDTRSFDAKKLTDERVRTKLDSYLNEYITAGKTYDDFREGVNDLFDRMGLGEYETYHIETILRTEAQTAANYGRYVSNIDAVDIAPLWQLVYVDDGNHQEGTVCHYVAEQGGLIKPATWDKWHLYHCPNHFNCRSFIIAIPRSVIKRDNIVPTGAYHGPKPAEGFDTPLFPMKKAA